MGRPRDRVRLTCYNCAREFERVRSAAKRSETQYCSRECWWSRSAVEDFVAFGEEDECWEWLGRLDQDGYGLSPNRSVNDRGAHRAMYRLYVGPIPEGLTLDHLCRNRSCVNPAHLEPVLNAENTRRGGNAIKTHCVNGHEFTEANIYRYTNERYPNGRRTCKACIFERSTARRKRLKT